ncbi:AsnC family protein [Streptomyces sp. NBC_00078]|uniref:AsnC family protein n=1 Tax=unclassified Streptomyces TaxID=2593676 RepID=UPI002251228C|nr:AsnC family protein [Streptomyces sp. NBC_00078]MCX5424482.1 AsnC family protein [Streptomyces sp. NBC_00078]
MPDDLDRALIHAPHIDGPAPFSRIATALDVSPQTVARRTGGCVRGRRRGSWDCRTRIGRGERSGSSGSPWRRGPHRTWRRPWCAVGTRHG